MNIYDPGKPPISRDGQNLSGAIGDDAIAGGGNLYFPTSEIPGSSVSIVSDSVEDSVGGTGCSVIYIKYLTTGYVEVEEYITLEGLTPVNMSNPFLGDLQIRAWNSGTNKTNVGNIAVTNGANKLSYMTAGTGRSFIGATTIPRTLINGKKVTRGIVHSIGGGVLQKTAANGVLSLKSFVEGTSWVEEIKFTVTNTTYFQLPTRVPVGIPPHTHLVVRIDELSAPTLPISCGFTISYMLD
jgi:hypothetical protein